jgi:general secretion pathway protein G
MPEQVQGTSSVKTSKSAIWSLVLGIIGIPLFFLLIPEVLAIVFGIIALVNIKKSVGALKGTGLAIAGLILGGLMIMAIPFIAILAAIAIPNIIKATNDSMMSMMSIENRAMEEAKGKANNQVMEAKTQADIANIGATLELYKLDSGCYPTTEQGLLVLLSYNEQGRRYIDKPPNDSWGNPYHYRCPGNHNQDTYDLWSLGADVQDGTQDDITNWQK